MRSWRSVSRRSHRRRVPFPADLSPSASTPPSCRLSSSRSRDDTTRPRGVTLRSVSKELLYNPADRGEVEELARPHDAHGLIVLPIEMPWCGVHGHETLGARRQRVPGIGCRARVGSHSIRSADGRRGSSRQPQRRTRWSRPETSRVSGCVKDDSQGRAWRVAVPAPVAWSRPTPPPRLRSSSCHGCGGVLAPTPGKA